MGHHVVPATFAVGEWVEFYRGDERRKVQVTAVNGLQVTARVFGQPMIFMPRHSDGRHVKLGSHDFEVMPDMIVRPEPAAPKTTSRWKDVRDFFHGMFWGA